MCPESFNAPTEAEVTEHATNAGEKQCKLEPFLKGTCEVLSSFGKGLLAKVEGQKPVRPTVPPIYQMVLAFIGAFASLLVIAAINSAIGGRISLPLLLAPFGATSTLLFVPVSGALMSSQTFQRCKAPAERPEGTLYLSRLLNLMGVFVLPLGMGTQPAAQPLNVTAGMLLSCVAGLIARTFVGAYVIAAAPLAVALSITAMQLTRTIHPPGGAMALLLAVLEPLDSIAPRQVSSIAIVEVKQTAWCIQSEMETSFSERLVHGLELTASALIGQAVLFIGALLINNIGPASRRYPVMW